MSTYCNMVEGIFLERPNRFIAYCQLGEEKVKVHVKNTGRCKELLVPGTQVHLQYHDNPSRKTKYSLINVKKGDRLINMDSQVPNEVCFEGIKSGSIQLADLNGAITLIKREHRYGDSRVDLYIETTKEKVLVEVKGVTLERDGIVKFPDAPTERGVKHILELTKAVKEGYKSYIIFIIQMEDVKYFTPNGETHQAFVDALVYGEKEGLHILAYDTKVTKDSIVLKNEVEVRLVEGKEEDTNGNK